MANLFLLVKILNKNAPNINVDCITFIHLSHNYNYVKIRKKINKSIINYG